MVIHKMATIQRPFHPDDDTAKRPITSPLILYHFTNTIVSSNSNKFFLRFAHLNVIWSHLFFNLPQFVILIKVLLKFLRFLIMGMKPKLGVPVLMTKDKQVARGNSFFFFFLDFVSLGWWMPELVTGGHLMLFGLQYYVWLLLCHKI